MNLPGLHVVHCFLGPCLLGEIGGNLKGFEGVDLEIVCVGIQR
jgi:hypothetical protein